MSTDVPPQQTRAPGTGSGVSAGSGTAAGTRLLAELRDEIVRADNKASVLVATLGIAAGLVGGLLTGHDWSPGRLGPVPATAWWLGTVSLGVALVALLLAIRPRYRKSGWRPGLPLTYFQDINQAAALGRLADALADTERDASAALLTSLTSNSLIVARKHQCVRTGLAAFGLSAVLLAFALIAG
ncbi:Pycsar system effector family protein [Streptacidiphilus sp. N1-12]|uniref:Pycsar system effector family protein n=2 Tax=Streptacidiphilus alkalitolerans TaxID=3342712 RepID=A0ABV6WCP6_9ACTN